MAQARHKAPSRARLVARRSDAVVVLTGVALLALAAVGAGMSSPSVTADVLAVAGSSPSDSTAMATDELSDLREERQRAVEAAARSAERVAAAVVAPAPAAPALPATTPAYTTDAVNVRAAATVDSPVVTVLDHGAEIGLTGRAEGDFVEIVLDGALAWVHSAYVSAEPPAEDAGGVSGAVSGEPCASGSSVESGLTTNAIAVHRAVCALFPGVSGYGGLRSGDGGEHGTGHALDIMVSSDLGNQIAAYLQAHAAELGVIELLWRQRIWTTERAGDGWRWMEDRGSATANHYDHVHVTVH